jgi:hypothetical protein
LISAHRTIVSTTDTQLHVFTGRSLDQQSEPQDRQIGTQYINQDLKQFFPVSLTTLLKVFTAFNLLPADKLFILLTTTTYFDQQQYRQVTEHDHDTRQTRYCVPRYNNDYDRQTGQHTVPYLLNQLPADKLFILLTTTTYFDQQQYRLVTEHDHDTRQTTVYRDTTMTTADKLDNILYQLPDEILQLTDRRQFKKKTKDFLLTKDFLFTKI